MVKKLTCDDLVFEKFSSFERYQLTKRKYVEVAGKLLLEDINFVNSWDQEALKGLVSYLLEEYEKGSYVVGKLKDDKVVAFACLRLNFFGNENQYIQLDSLHVTNNCRNLGLGKALFGKCIEKAKEIGAKKIYISAHPSYETQTFYQKQGCVLAKEKNKVLLELEPHDIHLEYVIN